MSTKSRKSDGVLDDTPFDNEPGFCPDCGSVLPLLGAVGGVICYGCKREFSANVYFRGHNIAMAETYKIVLNEVGSMEAEGRRDEKEVADGPVVERRCSRCGNDTMSYATLQLRSADEGQTIFYTCTKCKFKETENS